MVDAVTINLRISKERYAEMIREFWAAHPSMDSGDLHAYAAGMIRAIAVREGHAEVIDVLDALAEVLGWEPRS